jgi:hypothetical protein
VEAERRQVTVLFADMVGFTSFAERSGEEAAFTLMRSLWRLMADSVRDHGGVVQDFTGQQNESFYFHKGLTPPRQTFRRQTIQRLSA